MNKSTRMNTITNNTSFSLNTGRYQNWFQYELDYQNDYTITKWEQVPRWNIGSTLNTGTSISMGIINTDANILTRVPVVTRTCMFIIMLIVVWTREIPDEWYQCKLGSINSNVGTSIKPGSYFLRMRMRSESGRHKFATNNSALLPCE